MTCQIRYYTRSGNTEKLARAIAEAVEQTAQTVESPLSQKTDILFLGCSYYAFDMDEAVKKFITENKDHIDTIVCFGTSAMMKSMKKTLRKVIEGTGITLSEEEFHCRGEFGPFHKGHPNEKDLRLAAEFAKKIVNQ